MHSEYLLKTTIVSVQIPRKEIPQYTTAVVKELFAPLEASYMGVVGSEGLPTLLLCESLLSLLPTMSLRDMPYKLLREYEITPFTSGSIAREGRILLAQFATVTAGLLCCLSPDPTFNEFFSRCEAFQQWEGGKLCRCYNF